MLFSFPYRRCVWFGSVAVFCYRCIVLCGRRLNEWESYRDFIKLETRHGKNGKEKLSLVPNIACTFLSRNFYNFSTLFSIVNKSFLLFFVQNKIEREWNFYTFRLFVEFFIYFSRCNICSLLNRTVTLAHSLKVLFAFEFAPESPCEIVKTLSCWFNFPADSFSHLSSSCSSQTDGDHSAAQLNSSPGVLFKFKDSRNKSYVSSVQNSSHAMSRVATNDETKGWQSIKYIWDFSEFRMNFWVTRRWWRKGEEKLKLIYFQSPTMLLMSNDVKSFTWAISSQWHGTSELQSCKREDIFHKTRIYQLKKIWLKLEAMMDWRG